MLHEIHASGIAAASTCLAAAARLERGLRGIRQRDLAGASDSLHGLRYSVLSQWMSAGQPDPGVESPGAQGPLARRERTAARHQQFPRLHRPAVSGAL